VTAPLVSRPAYGEHEPRATAQLPSGSPAGKGLPLPDGEGYKTFSKPEDDIRDPETDPGSANRIDGPDSWAKEQDRPDVTDWVEQGGAVSPSYQGLGDKDPDDYSKTKYPYRNEKPDTHNASVEPAFIAELYILERKQPLLLRYKDLTAARVAATAEQILSGLNPKFVSRSRDVQVTLRRADRKNLRWIFSARGNKVYAVKVRATRPRKNTTKFSKMDVEVSCSCPAWQWQGPEFHSTHGRSPAPTGAAEYQLGPLMGTASPPNIRDPERQNFVCKHVAAVLASTRTWDIPI
jgi:SWIM zinc finger